VDHHVVTADPGPTVADRSRRGVAGILAARVYVLVVLLYLFLPVLVVVLFSFTTSPRLSLPIEGFTLSWYQSAFAEPLFSRALVNSLVLASITAVVAVALGVPFCFALARLRRRPRGVLLTASLLPMAVPVLVVGVALAILFTNLARPPSLPNAAVGHIVVALPFVILTVNARLETFDFSTLEAARDLGASPLRTFRDVTFPLIRPSVIGAALLAAALSLDEFVVTFFKIGNDTSLPVLVWGLLRRGIDPSINALASVVLLSLVGLVVASNILSRRGS
jgi:spermidine/putrescine transport system permease protein